MLLKFSVNLSKNSFLLRSHLEYVDDQGRRGMRVKFYLQGTRRRGTAQLDAREARTLFPRVNWHYLNF